jgi:mono/diheme cytochrome c family protein
LKELAMRQFTTRCGFAALIAVAAVLPAIELSAHAQSGASGDAANGQRIYLADGCFECHGRAGQGGAFRGPVPSIARVEMPAESFVAFLRDAPNDMPTYSANVLSDKEATDIYAFLQSLPGRKPAKDFPLLNQ